MKNKLYIILLMVVLSSCGESFITKNPEQSLDADLVLGNVDNLAVALNGVYNKLKDSDYYGRNFVVIPDIMGEDIEQSITNSNRLTLQFRYEVNANGRDAADYWSIAYSVINGANNIIASVDAAEGAQDRKDQILAEALSLRALAHFDLLRYFAQPYNLNDPQIADGANGQGGHPGVPLVLKPLSRDAQPSRDAVKKVYDQVIADLNRAIGLFTAGDGDRPRAVTISKEAAQGLLARVNLYKEDWAVAEKAATAVITSGKYKLLEAPDYLAAWDNLNPSDEAIFEIAFVANDFLQTAAIGYLYSEKGYHDVLPTKDLDDVMEEISNPNLDVRAGLWDTSVPVATKYKGPEATAGFENTVVMRLSEVYLIRAEARAEQGNFAGARADLNLLRSKRGIGDTGAGDTELVEAILKERRLELAFEGHRLWDITRKKKSVVRKDCRLSSSACTITYPDTRFSLPIPQAEIDANNNMTQNKGY